MMYLMYNLANTLFWWVRQEQTIHQSKRKDRPITSNPNRGFGQNLKNTLNAFTVLPVVSSEGLLLPFNADRKSRDLIAP